MKLYIAGPVSLGGTLPPEQVKKNSAAFVTAEAYLKRLGYEIESPVQPEDEEHIAAGKPYYWWVRRGFFQLLNCDGVALLPGWEKSLGTLKECVLAGLINIPVKPLDAWEACPSEEQLEAL